MDLVKRSGRVVTRIAFFVEGEPMVVYDTKYEDAITTAEEMLHIRPAK